MPYSIPFSDNAKTPITVNDLTANTTSTSLVLVGRNYSNYGVAIAGNFVKLLENFASATSPRNPIQGQLWYDSENHALKINDGTSGNVNWRPASGTHVKATFPTNPIRGDLWVNTTTQQLNLYNGENWVTVGPSALAGKKTGTFVESVVDAEGNSHFVTIEYANDSAIKIISTDSFFPEKTIEGFVQINPGINLSSKLFFGPTDTSTATTIPKLYGTATAADALNVTSPTIAKVSANDFVRKDTANILLGQQSIRNDAGLTLGSAQNFSLTVNQSNGLISNSIDSSNIDVRIFGGGTSNLIMRFDGKNKRVGINHPTPNVELDVNGSAYISGTLIAKGTLDSTSIISGALQTAGGAGIAKNLYVGKSVDIGQSLTIGEIDQSNLPVEGVAIIPRSSGHYDIGSTTNTFREVHAENFFGTFTGTIASGTTITANLSGTASSLSQPIRFRFDGDVTTTGNSFSGGENTTITSALSQQAITSKVEVVDNRPDDTLLVYRTNVGLRKVTRTSFLLGEAFTPIGAILPYAGPNAPTGYLLCDGRLVKREDYPLLYQTIGSTYGAGTDPAYFRLPDLRGRFPLGRYTMQNDLQDTSVVPIASNDTTRIINESSNTSPGTLGGVGGNSHVTVDTNSGTNNMTFPSGAAQNVSETLDVNVTNPYLSLNYIIRSGVGGTSY